MNHGARHAASTDEVEGLIAQLEQQMPEVQMRHTDLFALANAWAERYDAVIAATPAPDRPAVEARLGRIGIRWGVMPGARVTTEFRALAMPEDAEPTQQRGEA
ncbi:MAG: hypothetical protein ACJ8GK_03765 [Luteimonas sp.]